MPRLENVEIEGGGYGILDVSGSLTISTSLQWNGTLQGSGQTVVQGKLLIGDAYHDDAWLKGHRLTNAGTAVYAGSSIYTTEGALLTNAAGAVFDVQCDGYIHNQAGADSSFSNAGTLRKSAGTGTATMAIPFSNTGVLDVQSGTLALPSISRVHDRAALTVGPLAGVSLGGDLAGSVRSPAVLPPGNRMVGRWHIGAVPA